MKFDALRPSPATSDTPYRDCNNGNDNPMWPMDCIAALVSPLGVTAKKSFLPMQPVDVPAT